MSDSTKFLDAYVPEAAWALEHRISQRTVARYRSAPDGLPFLVWGGGVYIPRHEGAEYIKARVKRRNKRRRPGDG
jgi:hypothetical protein